MYNATLTEALHVLYDALHSAFYIGIEVSID